MTDITYVPTAEGWLFLAAIVDLFSRRIVGWAMDATMHRSLVLKALAMAVIERQPGVGLIHHSDRGGQYASADYRAALDTHGMIASMSRPGCCSDNAAAESFWHTIKNELVQRRYFQAREEARPFSSTSNSSTAAPVSQHTTIGNFSPVEFKLQRAKAA